MRRLLYIIMICIATVTAIVAQPPELSVAEASAATQDSLPSDTAVASDSLTPPAAHARAGRNRRVTPVDNAATRTQHHNDAEGDTARMLERRRQRSIHYHDANGNTVMVDTITGEEWVDSTMLPKPPKMHQPLLFAAEVGVNVWDPVMRIFGQKYGIVDFSAAINLHNRYIPTVEVGIGAANSTPATMNFTYRTPPTPYFKIGADYNFIYNSDPDYRFVFGLRYGFSAFRYSLEDVTFNNGYWGEAGSIAFPSQSVTAGWLELGLGLRVRIVGPISAGWMFRYHTMLHQSRPATGNPWYIPGYGTEGSALSGSFSIVYNFALGKRHAQADGDDKHHHHHDD